MAALPVPAVHDVALTPDDGVLSLHAWDASTNNWAIWNISASCPLSTASSGDLGTVFRRGGGGVRYLGGVRYMIVQMNAPDDAPTAPSADELLAWLPTKVLTLDELTHLNAYEVYAVSSDPETGEGGLDAPHT
jgi:hypothetical protein